MTLRDLAQTWRADAERFARYGAAELAKACEYHADQLEAALRHNGDEPLDLATAHRESGLSVSRLRHMVAEGKVPNAGKKGSPLIRRADLPAKRRRSSSTFDAAATARELLHGATR